jgi:peptide/nickel transport system permease protein
LALDPEVASGAGIETRRRSPPPGANLGLFALRRLVTSFFVLLVLSFGVFGLLEIAPGSQEQLLIGTRPATPEYRAALRKEYHLDQSFMVRYWYWLGDVGHFRLGYSASTGEPVTKRIKYAAGPTLLLGGLAFLITMVVGVGLGCLAAIKRGTAWDRGIVGLSVLGIGAPVFATGVILLYIFGVLLGWFPTYGAGTGVGGRLWHATLPTIALGASVGALVIKLTRSAVIDAGSQDFVVFARARGVPSGKLYARHVLRNALIPVITAGGVIMIYVLTGAVLIETTFSRPGLGSLLVEAVQAKDVPVVQGVVLVFGALILLINLLVDVGYILADPRIKLGGGKRP